MYRKEIQNSRETPLGGVYCRKLRKQSVVNGLTTDVAFSQHYGYV